ncbi:thermonuclease family protein [Bacillus sp. Wb]
MEAYFYNAECIRVIDGDTAEVNLDVGFNFSTKQKIRFLGVNTPERHQVGYSEATNYTAQKILGKSLLIRTVEKDSFGRWLADVYYHDDGEFRSLNNELLEKGLAVKFM